MSRRISDGGTPAASRATLAAFAAIEDVQSSDSATWRDLIPVCDHIHSSFVSSDFERSSFVTTLGGK